jgi:MerR family transcriptional regulator, copper efflux regulator
MVTTQDPQQRRLVLQRRHAELRARIAQLQASSEILGCALRCDHEDFAHCADFHQMVADRIGLDPRPDPSGCAVASGSRSG